jgi:hypothetical protein
VLITRTLPAVTSTLTGPGGNETANGSGLPSTLCRTYRSSETVSSGAVASEAHAAAITRNKAEAIPRTAQPGEPRNTSDVVCGVLIESS